MRCLILFVLAGCPGSPLTSASQPTPGSDLPGCQNTVEYQAGSVGVAGSYGYDQLGRLVSYAETDESYRFERDYDEYGRRAVERETVIGLGPVDRSSTWAYDDLDRVVTRKTDLDGKITITDYEYDAAGRLARRATHAEHSSTVRYEYIEGEPFVIVYHYEDSDGVERFAHRLVFEAHARAQRRLTRIESVRGLEVTAYTDYRYDGEHLVLVESDWASNHSAAYTWDGDRIAHAVYTILNYPVQSVDYTYDTRDRVVRRDWHTGQGAEVSTTGVWGPAGLTRVERSDAKTGEPIETWTIDRECNGEMPALIAPVTVWARELEPMDYVVELEAHFPSAF